jgi:hypothetical protein
VSKASSSFLKKEPKTFVIIARVSGQNRDSEIKVFCFFSSEKKAFLPACNEYQRSQRKIFISLPRFCPEARV